MKFKIFNDNDIEIEELQQEDMPIITVSTHGCMGIYFNEKQAWFNLNYHSFQLVEQE